MKKIYKYTLSDYGLTSLGIGDGDILGVANQQGAIVLWAEVDSPSNFPYPRHFIVCYTGDEAPKGKYIGTVLSQGGNIVSHVYEVNL